MAATITGKVMQNHNSTAAQTHHIETGIPSAAPGKAAASSPNQKNSADILKQDLEILKKRHIDKDQFEQIVDILKACKLPKDGANLPSPELALRRAAAAGKIDAVKDLARFVKDLRIKEVGADSGKTAFDFAKQHKREEVAAFLDNMKIRTLAGKDISAGQTISTKNMDLEIRGDVPSNVTIEVDSGNLIVYGSIGQNVKIILKNILTVNIEHNNSRIRADYAIKDPKKPRGVIFGVLYLSPNSNITINSEDFIIDGRSFKIPFLQEMPVLKGNLTVTGEVSKTADIKIDGTAKVKGSDFVTERLNSVDPTASHLNTTGKAKEIGATTSAVQTSDPINHTIISDRVVKIALDNLNRRMKAETAPSIQPSVPTPNSHFSTLKDQPLAFKERFEAKIKEIFEKFDTNALAGSGGAETVTVDGAGVKKKTFDVILQKCLPAIIGFEHEKFVIRVRNLKTQFEQCKGHAFFTLDLNEIQLSAKDCQTLFEEVTRNLAKSVQPEEAVLNALQETDDVKAHMVEKQKVLERKKNAAFKQDCDDAYVQYSSVVAEFNRSTHFTKSITEQLNKEYTAIKSLLKSNNAALESSKAAQKKIQGETGDKKCDRAIKKAESDLKGNSDRKTTADNCNKKSSKLLKDDAKIPKGAGAEIPKVEAEIPKAEAETSNLEKIRENFQESYDKAVKEMNGALQQLDLKKMQEWIAPLQKCQKECDEKLKQLQACLSEMRSIAQALREQAERLSVGQQHEEALEKLEDDKAWQDTIKEQAAILAQINADIKRQRDSEKQQAQLKKREEDRTRWLVGLQSMSQVRLTQQTKARAAREAAQKEMTLNADAKKDAEITKRARPRPLTLGQQLDSHLHQHKIRVRTQDHLHSLRCLLEEEFSFLESRQELEGYAVLGKLAQLLEAMQPQKGSMGILAREVRTSLYHHPEIIKFSGKGALQVGQLIDMVIELLLMGNEPGNTALPAYFVRLALFPRKHEKTEAELTQCTADDLAQFIVKFDKDQAEHVRAEKGAHKFTAPTNGICEKSYRVYEKQLEDLRKKHAGCSAPEAMRCAIGYLEGLLGSYASIARARKEYKGFLRGDKQVTLLIKRGRMFRHNAVSQSTEGYAAVIQDVSDLRGFSASMTSAMTTRTTTSSGGSSGAPALPYLPSRAAGVSQAPTGGAILAADRAALMGKAVMQDQPVQSKPAAAPGK